MVLLKNEGGALPVAKGEKVALFGKAQIDFIKGGTVSRDVNGATHSSGRYRMQSRC